jgi:pyrimidine-specific ribonucleoside hydrolase
MHIRGSLLAGILLLLVAQALPAHEMQRTPVIVDTDVALDDVRALTLLLLSDEVELRAAVTSDGASTPEQGARGVRTVLRFLGFTEIPVAAGTEVGGPPPAWRAMSESLGWSDLGPRARAEDDDSRGTAEELICQILEPNEAKVTYICLGPLTNLAAALAADSALTSKLACVYYSGTPPAVEPASWNTARDTAAASAVFDRPLKMFSYQVPDDDLLVFDSSLLAAACRAFTRSGELLCQLHSSERVRKLALGYWLDLDRREIFAE